MRVSKESAKNFLLNFDIGSEVNKMVEKTIKDNNKNKEKLNMMAYEASKHGYNFTVNELKQALEEISAMSEGDLSNVAGGTISDSIIGTVKGYFFGHIN